MSPGSAGVIREAGAADAQALYSICLRTGDAGADATDRYTEPDLLGDVYVGPYLHLADGFGLAAESQDGRALGYVLGTADSTGFAAACAAQWWPAVRARHPLAAPAGVLRTTADEQLVAQLHDPPEPDPALVARHPAHLHIDLLPEAQGRGLGRTLVETFFARLREQAVPGVHLGVDPRNHGAVAFYERLGFHVWDAAEGVILVRDLAG